LGGLKAFNYKGRKSVFDIFSAGFPSSSTSRWISEYWILSSSAYTFLLMLSSGYLKKGILDAYYCCPILIPTILATFQHSKAVLFRFSLRLMVAKYPQTSGTKMSISVQRDRKGIASSSRFCYGYPCVLVLCCTLSIRTHMVKCQTLSIVCRKVLASLATRQADVVGPFGQIEFFPFKGQLTETQETQFKQWPVTGICY